MVILWTVHEWWCCDISILIRVCFLYMKDVKFAIVEVKILMQPQPQQQRLLSQIFRVGYMNPFLYPALLGPFQLNYDHS